jgi:mannose-6-phosphate isomerase-like protein (cupin superfamily)
MQAFELSQIIKAAEKGGNRYHEFLRVPELSMGLYRLAAGEPDPQSPHQQDEVYYVLKGQAKIRVNDEIREVGPGSIVYVEKLAPHKFIDIQEDLEILVFFAPAEAG